MPSRAWPGLFSLLLGCGGGTPAPAAAPTAAPAPAHASQRCNTVPACRPACAAGHDCARLAQIYGFELQVSRGAAADAGVAELLTRACVAGDPQVCGRLGAALCSASGATCEPEALRLLERGCDGGEATACALLGSHAADQHRGAALRDRSTVLAERACEAGEREACLLLASRYSEAGLLPRAGALAARAGRLYRQACLDDDALACLMLAVMVARKDAADAKLLAAHACELGLRAPGCKGRP